MDITTYNAKGSENGKAIGKTTDNGTPIRQPGEELGKSAFFQILAAELANQDPTQPQDTTAYISQLAQFSSLEQMSNLNTTMTLSAAQNLTGKFVALDTLDANGIPEMGVVRAVYKRGSDVFVTVEDVSGKFKDYNYSQVTDVIDSSDTNMDNITFINASALIGKTVEIAIPDKEDPDKGETEETPEVSEDGLKADTEDGSEVDPEKPKTPKTVTGVVTEVYRDSEGIKIKIIDENGKEISYLYDQVIKIKETPKNEVKPEDEVNPEDEINPEDGATA